MKAQQGLRRALFLACALAWIGLVISFDLRLTNFFNWEQSTELIQLQENLRDSASLLDPASAQLFLQNADRLASIHAEHYLLQLEVLNGFIIFFLMLALICSLIIAFPEKIARAKGFSKSQSFRSSSSLPDQLDETAQDLQRAADDLSQYLELEENASVKQEKTETVYELLFDTVIGLASLIYSQTNELDSLMEIFQGVDSHLQKLASQCGDNANFAAATRLEWNTMGNKLRQIRESHEKIKSNAEKATKLQRQSDEILAKTLEFQKIHGNHAGHIKSNMIQMHENSKRGYRSLDEMTSAIGQSKDDVLTASDLVKGLSERAEAIVNIIDVIDDIAEQTNQLALNASIEAARAGEQGQGFAVVAGEVRNLAARSSTATKSITDLLGTIQEEAEKASTKLQVSSESVRNAHGYIREVDQSYRESTILTRQSISALDALNHEVTIHLSTLKQIEKQNHEINKHLSHMNNLMDDQGRMTTVVASDCNQLTVNSDRFSRFLNRQFYESSHCQRVLNISLNMMSDLRRKLAQSHTETRSIKDHLHALYKSSMTNESQSKRQLLSAVESLQTIRSHARTLEVWKHPERSDLSIRETLRPSDQDLQNTNAPAEQAITNKVIEKLPEDDFFIGEKHPDNNKAG
ncbi:MAG: methyl-accepting chemotaxis protein [Oligoflexus sp.]